MSKAVNATVVSIRKPMIEGFRIPIPPLDIQNEIVRILDKFVSLANELEVELATRVKQYEFYKKQTLSFADCISKPLELCCYIQDTKRRPVSKAARKAGEYPYYGANGIQDYVSDYIFDGTFVLVGEDGSVINENGNPIVNWAKGKIWVNNHAHIISEKEGYSLRFLYYFLQSVNVSHLIHGNIPKLTQGDFKQISIPDIPLDRQKEIVAMLDNFDLLCASNESGLPAEIEARRKQYEYYRNLLLSFKECHHA